LPREKDLSVEFGIFDHLDRSGEELGDLFESRLKLIELIEQQNFYGYHLAEHHSTPLGAVASPSVFLAAAIQRTRRIRLGPLVYVLPLYHPLRLFEEICMLDHMSNGRLMLGVGRGGALLEHERFGVDPATASARYHEAFTVLMRAFKDDVLNFEGEFFKYRDYLVQARPLQSPHPPIWYGAPSAEAIMWGVSRGINVVSLGPTSRAREISDRYRKEWVDLGRRPSTLPRIGITRHIVVAETDAAAKSLARRAYVPWRKGIAYLWEHANADFTLKEIYPETFEELCALGHGVAGSPATVCAFLSRLEQETGVNYVLGQMIFGDMTFDEAASSIRLFGSDVMPAFAEGTAPVSERSR
jgi:alkanesulfonate monooxygenase SsuD/methylene tetrahydromethanopterin reductase-like flavin-dependent oxidoreductase (luciferase family)